MQLYYFYALKALWDGQGKSKMYYGMPRVKKQLSGKRSILLSFGCGNLFHECYTASRFIHLIGNINIWKVLTC